MRTFSAAVICVACAATIGCAGRREGAATAVIPGARAAATQQTPLIFAVNLYGYSVTGYTQSANGDVSPVIDIAGSQTKIDSPSGLAANRKGTVAVTNANNQITFYAPGANGNVAPIRTLGCGSGGHGVPGELGYDSHGRLYVKFYMGHKAPSDAIAIYKPNQQSGCVTSNHMLYGDKTQINFYGGIAVGRRMIFSAAYGAILGFHTSDNGNVAPSIVIEGNNTGLSNANGIAVDQNGYLYVANGSDVLVFAPSANGNATPAAVISGALTLIPPSGYGAQSIALGQNGQIFVGVINGTSYSILVFAAGSNGNVAPLQVITGSSTGLDWMDELSAFN